MEKQGEQELHEWFGLSYASFLTIPRVLMREMPDEWQGKMAALLREYDETFDTSKSDIGGTTVRATDVNGKLIHMPMWLRNYRRPDRTHIDKMRLKNK